MWSDKPDGLVQCMNRTDKSRRHMKKMRS